MVFEGVEEPNWNIPAVIEDADVVLVVDKVPNGNLAAEDALLGEDALGGTPN